MVCRHLPRWWQIEEDPVFRRALVSARKTPTIAAVFIGNWTWLDRIRTMVIRRLRGEAKEPIMLSRPRTKASRKRRALIKKQRRDKKTLSRVMPMLSRPKKKLAAA